MTKVINPKSLRIGDRVTLYQYQDGGDCIRYGTVTGRHRASNSLLITLDRGYTECWWMNNLAAALNDMTTLRLHNQGRTTEDIAMRIVNGEELS